MDSTKIETIDAIQHLESTGDFQVIKKLPLLDSINEVLTPVGAIKIVCVLDVETTGLDYETDEIIELAYSLIEFDEEGNLFNVLKRVDVFNQPNKTISEKITSLTGITNEIVNGIHIDWDSISIDFANVDLIVAHNASFDRKFVEKYHNVFTSIPWACSVNQIDWISLTGVSSRSQEFLAWKVGNFYYNAHRAIDDINALSYLISLKPENNDKTFFQYLVDNLNKKHYLIKAVGAAFAFKDELKSKGYFWNVGDRVWQKIVSEPADQEDITWLAGIGVNNPTIKAISNLDMFSIRSN